MNRVSGLYRVGLMVNDLEAAAQFYRSSWQMTSAGGDDTRRLFRSQRADHVDLVIKPAAGPGLDHIAFSVPDESTLRAVVARVEAAGHEVSRPVAWDAEMGELRASIQDHDGSRLDLVVHSPMRKDVDTDGRHRRLGHVVLWTGHIEAQEAFYALLGFQVSDRTHVNMSFLRCNTDHHSIALAKSTSGLTGLQHVAYDIGSVDDVMREYGRLRDSGVECIWGVGRHGPGNNVFSYYRDPAGNVVENYGDMDKVDEAEEVVEPRFWGPEHKGDVWGVAGTPPKAFRS